MRPCSLPLLALLACAQPPSSPSRPAEARAPDEVRVATWNVHDLFDSADRIVPPGELDDVPTAEDVDAKLALLSAVLGRLDADVLLLQEVENRAVLERLAVAAGYAEARLVEGRDPRGIDVAVLSRLPISQYVSHLGELGPDGRALFPRDCVEVHLSVAGGRLAVVGSHFSSALSDDGTRRGWQAARLREIADAIASGEPGALVLAGGDLNDGAESVALEPLLADGAWIDAAPAGPTWIGATAARELDHLLVPRARADAVVRAEVLSGADVSAASDHRPVALDLRLDGR